MAPQNSVNGESARTVMVLGENKVMIGGAEYEFMMTQTKSNLGR